MKIFFLSMIMFFLSSVALANELKPFYTDGCTLFADGTRKRPGLWKHCCVEHDLRYWFGGNLQERDTTDLYLRSCVDNMAGPKWAQLIYSGVMAGHSSPVKSKTFWGWGWKTLRGDISLSPEEKLYVKTELRSLPMDSVAIEEFILKYFGHEQN